MSNNKSLFLERVTPDKFNPCADLIFVRFRLYHCFQIYFIPYIMKRFVKCFFELLTENFSAWRETGQKKGRKTRL